MREQVLVLTKSQQLLQAEVGEPLPEFLRRRYIDEGRTLAEIGVELKVGLSTLSRWLDHFDIEARRPGQLAEGRV